MIKNLNRFYKRRVTILDEKSMKFNNFYYQVSRIIIWLLSKIFFPIRIKIEKLEEIPSEGAAVIVASHKNWMDIILLCLINPRNIHYVARKSLYKNKFITWYFNATGVIPIARGEKDSKAISKIVETLKNGEIVAIYPEGTRYKGDGIGELNSGIAIILLRNKIYPPIHPVVISYKKGKYFGLPLRVKIIVGEKIIISKHVSVRNLMEMIQSMLIDLYLKSKK